MQDTEQVVCQLLIATLCRNFVVNWHGIAGNLEKPANFSRQMLRVSGI
jgi:hypothetical protein